MRITRFHIDRFGVLADQDVADLSPGLSIFLGRNEAGKSTCLQFFRAMLFNYRRGRTTLDPMPTKKNTLAGGSLFLHTKRFGDIVLTRRPEKGGAPELRLAGGAPLAESDLQMLLQGMTAEVFDNVFAFNLKSLMEVSSLNGESVRHALHGAAFGLGMRSPSLVLKHLEDRMTALLKRDRIDSQAGINNTLQALLTVQEELAAQGPDMRRYADIQKELEATEIRLAEVVREKEGLTLQRLDAQRRLSLWPQWDDLRRVRAELALWSDEERALATACSFTPDALQRLDMLLAQQEERALATADHSAALARLEAEIQPHAAARLVPLLEPLRGLQEQKGMAKSDADALTRLGHEAHSLLLLQEQELARLGWDSATLAQADTSLAAKDSIRQQEARLNERAAALALHTREQERLQEEYRQAEEQCAIARREAAFAPSAPLPEEAQADALMAALTAARSAQAEIPALMARKEDAAAQAAQALQDIYPGWTAATLAEADISLPARHGFHTAAEKMLAAEEAVRERTAQAAAAEQELARAGEAAAAAGQQLALYADIPEETVLEQRMGLLKRMELCAHDLRQAQKRYEEANAALSDLVAPRRAEAGGRGGQDASPRALPGEKRQGRRWPWVLAGLVCGAGSGLLSALGLGSLGEPGFLLLYTGMSLGELTPLLLYASAGLALCAALFFGVSLFRKPQAEPLPAEDGEQAQQQCILARAAAEQEQERARAALLALVEQARPWLAAAPLETPSEAALAGAMHSLERQRQRRVLYERDLTGHQAAMRALATAQEQCRRHTLLREEAQAHLHSQSALWGSRLRTMHLPEHTAPAALQGFFDRVLFARAQAAAAAEASAAFTRALSRVALCLETARALPFRTPYLEAWEARFARALAAIHAEYPFGAETPAPPRQPVELPLLPGILPRTAPGAGSPQGRIDPAHLERLFRQAESHDFCTEGLACIAKALADIRALREQEQARKAALALLAERENALARIAERRTAATAKAKQARLDMESATAEWQNRLVAHRLPPTLSPATAAEAVDLIVALRTREKRIAQTAADENILRGRLQRFLDEVGVLAEKAGAPLPEGIAPDNPHASLPPMLELLEHLNRQAEEAALAATRHKEQRVRLGEIKRALDQARHALESTNTALAALLHTARTSDPEVFRVRFAQWERHTALEREERGLLAAFHTAAADAGQEPDAFLKACAAHSREELEVEHAGLAEALRGVEAELARLAEERGSLRERQAALVSGKGSAPLRQEAALLQDQLRAHAREWQVLALARHLLLTAKGQFEKEGQQGVIGTAGRLFASITQGEYTGITLNLEDEKISVIHHSGVLKDPEKALSQGSREQLYLALRLAYIRNHAANAEPVPVIMDDILVNFDPHRMARTAETLATFARNNQILFFTCHPHMADLLLDAGKNACKAEAASPPPALFRVHRGSIGAGR